MRCFFLAVISWCYAVALVDCQVLRNEVSYMVRHIGFDSNKRMIELSDVRDPYIPKSGFNTKPGVKS